MKYCLIMKRREETLAPKIYDNISPNCRLDDLGYEEDMFTWQRGMIQERLEWGYAQCPMETMVLRGGHRAFRLWEL